jgi:protein SCO1/2
MRVHKSLYYFAAAVAAVIIGLGIGYWTFGRRPATSSTSTSTLLLHPPKPLPAFGLETDTHSPFTIASLRGHWSLLYFGYSHCQDVCPTTLADLGKMNALLADLPAALRPRTYFISVDPKRDTPAVLARYVHYFDENFTGVTGPVDQLRLLTRALGVAFTYDPPNQSGNYSVEHSALAFLINPQAREQAIFTPPMVASRMANDYRIIVNQYGDR